MPTSEIDDIFASKGRLPPSARSKPSSPTRLSDKEKKSKKKRKTKDEDKPLKRKRDETDDPPPPKSAKRKVPETVFDPSAALPSARQSKTAKAETSGVSAVKSKKPKKAREEEDRFKDSRGTGPRRKTDEGFPIYKEDELGIIDQGGDTPLCPFDCQCCF